MAFGVFPRARAGCQLRRSSVPAELSGSSARTTWRSPDMASTDAIHQSSAARSLCDTSQCNQPDVPGLNAPSGRADRRRNVTMNSGEVSGTVITGTGFCGAARQQIKTIVSNLGAVYSGDLQREHTTYLVLAAVDDQHPGEKVARARDWGIPVIGYDWLLDSAAKGQILDIQPYLSQCNASDEDAPEDCWSAEKLRACSTPAPQPLFSPGEAGSVRDKLSPPCAAQRPANTLALPPLEQDAQSDRSSTASFSLGQQHVAPHMQPADQQEELDAMMAHMGSLSHEDDEEGCCASRAPVRTLQGSLLRGARSEATAADTAGPSTLHSLPVMEDEGADSQEAGVRVRVGRPLKTRPRGSTAAAFHGLGSARALTYYDELAVAHAPGSSGVPCVLRFRLRDRKHCALMFYEEREEEGLRELAYADLLYCYTIEGAPADAVWVEHGYLYDLQDLEAHPMGRKYLETQAMEDAELVETSACYHSLASVIEGEFWLTSRKQAQAGLAGGQHYFCERCWDRRTGACMPRGKRTSTARPVQA